MGYVLISGGTGGLGKELARLYAAQGRPLLIAARNRDKLQELAGELQGPTIWFAGDLSKRGSVVELFEMGASHFGQVELVINALGAGRFGSFESLDESQLIVNLETNLLPVLWICQLAIRDMSVAGGLMVNVLSSAARVGRANEVAYCAAKWAVRGVCESLQALCKGSSTRIMSVFPGGMRTDFWKTAGLLPKEYARFMEPSAVARVIGDAVKASEDGLHVEELVITRRT